MASPHSKRSLAIPREIFRAYDIRGLVDQTLTQESVELIGRAIGTQILDAGEQQVVVGRDGRLSGPVLMQALKSGLMATGIHVIDIGLVPTPVLYFATHALNIPSGIILTGSHNPSDYNGLKIMIGGSTLCEEAIQALYHNILGNKLRHGQGTCIEAQIDDRYIDRVQDIISLKKRLKVVIDAGNGATGNIAPRLYKALGCDVIPLFCEIDGAFPNHHPDPGNPSNLEALRQSVLHHEADIGLAFDGDGDRLGVVDNQGNIIWPDRQLILFARDILSRHPNALILFDVKCTQHLAKDILQHGGNPCMWKTGHSLIKTKMKENGALLGGEMSGHFFFKERWYGFDDGLYAGARLLEIVSGLDNQTVADCFASLPDSVNTPELKLAVSETEKAKLITQLIQLATLQTEAESFKDGVINTIDGLRVDWNDGFGLVRCSNTGPNLVMRFEGSTIESLHKIQDKFRLLFETLAKSQARDWILPF